MFSLADCDEVCHGAESCFNQEQWIMSAYDSLIGPLAVSTKFL